MQGQINHSNSNTVTKPQWKLTDLHISEVGYAVAFVFLGRPAERGDFKRALMDFSVT